MTRTALASNLLNVFSRNRMSVVIIFLAFSLISFPLCAYANQLDIDGVPVCSTYEIVEDHSLSNTLDDSRNNHSPYIGDYYDATTGFYYDIGTMHFIIGGRVHYYMPRGAIIMDYDGSHGTSVTVPRQLGGVSVVAFDFEGALPRYTRVD